MTREDLQAAVAVCEAEHRPVEFKGICVLVDADPKDLPDVVEITKGLSGENWGPFKIQETGAIYTVVRISLLDAKKWLATN